MSEVQPMVSSEETAKLAEVSELVEKAKGILSGLGETPKYGGIQKSILQLIEGLTVADVKQMFGLINQRLDWHSIVQVPS